ncbi:hypothetical protein DB771_05825 [Burkholderia sp. AU29985]|nr:hypothetical protein EGY28_02095 [Burkholderia dolosa]PRE47904.1 hypothetical protein C6P87_16810 [Burkholderia sp. AU12872]PUA77785.1 hypothetical protein DB771_05825 [Burkholderia sp. AU29985]
MSFGARGAARVVAGLAWPGACRASDDRYLIGVRPVFINVFVGDLVEIPAHARAARKRCPACVAERPV